MCLSLSTYGRTDAPYLSSSFSLSMVCLAGRLCPWTGGTQHGGRRMHASCTTPWYVGRVVRAGEHSTGWMGGDGRTRTYKTWMSTTMSSLSTTTTTPHLELPPLFTLHTSLMKAVGRYE